MDMNLQRIAPLWETFPGREVRRAREREKMLSAYSELSRINL